MGSAVGDGAPYIFCDLLNDHYQAFPIISSRFPSTNILASNKNQGIGCWDRSLYLRYDSLFTNVEELKTYLSAHPLTVYYQSTAYDGTNGLDICLTGYHTGYIESYADESITTAWISSTGALSTGAEVAYVLSSPETYATDPVDFDNTAGPLTVLTGGEVEVYNTSLVGERELNLKANINDVLLLDNKNPYTPTSNYNPATKKYVDDAMASAGTGDMLKNVYDTNNNGIVDNAEKVNGLTVQTAVPANAKFTDTTYGVVSTSANGLAPKLPGNTTSYLRGDGTWATISVPSGAVSGVKGNAESTYRTGNVNLTPANIGAIPNGGAASLTDELTINASGHPITVSNGNISIEDANISIVNGELNYDAGTY